METDTFEKLSKKIDRYRGEMIEMQKSLIPIKAVSPTSGGRGELAKAKFLEHFLKEIFGDLTWINAPHAEAEKGIRPNIVCTLAGKDSNKTMWFMVHMDVVPAGDESLWQTPPFSAVIKDGKIYGRGSEDDHQGLISSLFAIKAIKDENITPSCNIGLLLVSDEESGSDYGLKYILDKHPDIFKKDDFFIIPDTGSADGRLISIAEKGIMRFKITIIGKQAHAAYPNHGINANRIISNFIVRLDELGKKYKKENLLFDPPTCTMEATQRYLNVENGNTVPGKEIQIFDCRIIPDYDFDEIFAEITGLAEKIEKEFGGQITIEKLVYDRPAPITSKDSAIVNLLKKAIGHVYTVEAIPQGSSGGTVARFLRYRGFSVVTWLRRDVTAHNPNEYCVIDNMVNDTKVFAHVIMD